MTDLAVVQPPGWPVPRGYSNGIAGSGRVVNISMNHETMVRAGFAPYGPAGAGVEALSRVMAADLAGSPVTVNMLLPGGATATGMRLKLANAGFEAISSMTRRVLSPMQEMPLLRWRMVLMLRMSMVEEV